MTHPLDLTVEEVMRAYSKSLRRFNPLGDGPSGMALLTEELNIINESKRLAERGNSPTVDEIVVWFDAWLKHKITARESMLISEVVHHALKYPADVHRANADAEPRTPGIGGIPNERVGMFPLEDHSGGG